MTDATIDMAVVQELLEIAGGDDPELLLDLIDMFLEDAPARVAAIGRGLRDGDLEAVERAAHSLKGSAGNLGAGRVQDLAESLQLAGREQDAAAVTALLPQLEQQYAVADAALRALRQRYA